MTLSGLNFERMYGLSSGTMRYVHNNGVFVLSGCPHSGVLLYKEKQIERHVIVEYSVSFSIMFLGELKIGSESHL